VIRDAPGCTDPCAQRRCVDMRVEHLDAVMGIENAAYAVPWTRGNFIDSLANGCTALCLLDAGHALLGYAVTMTGAGEVHLLNLTIAPPLQGRGHARHLLGELLAAWRDAGVERAWLEVRAGNLRAQRLYRRFGFVEVGRRRGYYPLPAGAASAAREDAITMRLPLSEAAP
jgi:[ribosomal protein S18]-alanine N-acetyltransferase